MYGTVASADTYFSDYTIGLNTWQEEPETQRTAALNVATMLVDNLNFSGDKTDEDQAHEFPRNDETEVPEEIKRATYEIARALLDGADVEKDAVLLNNTGINFGAITKKTANFVPEHLAHNIPSVLAWSLLQPFLRTADITLIRTS